MNYYIPPSIGKTQIVRNNPSQQYVNTGPLPDTRVIRKYFSSISPCNKAGSLGYLYTANLSETLRKIASIRFLTMQISFTPLGVSPVENTGFIVLEGDLEYRETDVQTTSSGQKYSAKFVYPVCVSPEQASTQFEYTFPENYYQNVEVGSSLNRLKVKILKEDSTTGELIPMTNVLYSNLELELHLALSSFQTY